MLPESPEVAPLDRLALWLEGGGRGTAVERMLDLGEVLAVSELQEIAPEIVRFYRDPLRFWLSAGVEMGTWSRVCMAVFTALFRQGSVPDRTRGTEAYPVCQRLYRDAAGRLHWDRYAQVDGRMQRLFVARLAGARGWVTETFVLYGVPVRLSFRARREGDGVRMTLAPGTSSLPARLARVEYRTRAVDAQGLLETRGDFRVPCIGLHVTTLFRMKPHGGGLGAWEGRREGPFGDPA